MTIATATPSKVMEQTVISTKLFNVFQQYSDRKVYFVEPGGNFGDHLIYKGAYKLANLARLVSRILTFSDFEGKKFTSDDVIYLHGGGGFVPWWSGKPMKMLKKLSDEFCGTLILGPTTFSENTEYIQKVFQESFGSHRFKKFYIFTRDKVSFGILEKYLPCEAEIACDHDTALNLVKSDLVKKEAPPGKYVMYAMRQDKERPASQGYNYLSWLDPIDVSSTFDQWLQFHLRAKKIVTNRTHSTIVGSILGIPTVMLPNSYHKNRSVWEHSLRGRGVEWLDRIDCTGINETIERNAWLKKMFTSRKYRKFLKLKLNVLGL